MRQGLRTSPAAQRGCSARRARRHAGQVRRGLRDELARGRLACAWVNSRACCARTPARARARTALALVRNAALNDIRPINHIVGPPGSVARRARVAHRRAAAGRGSLPAAGPRRGRWRLPPRGCVKTPPYDRASMPPWLWLVEDGAAGSKALTCAAGRPSRSRRPRRHRRRHGKAVASTPRPSEALIASTCCRRGAEARPLFLAHFLAPAPSSISRSARHEFDVLAVPGQPQPGPIYVAPFEGAPGYEAVATLPRDARGARAHAGRDRVAAEGGLRDFEGSAPERVLGRLVFENSHTSRIRPSAMRSRSTPAIESDAPAFSA